MAGRCAHTHTHTHTHRQTNKNERIISAIHFVHLAEIINKNVYTVSGKKSLRFTIHTGNFNKFRYIFILFGMNYPETSLY